MHEDPTRMMRTDDDDPDGHRPHGNMRLLVACLIAVIVGLVIAVVVIADSDSGDSSTATHRRIDQRPKPTDGHDATTRPTATTSERTTTERRAGRRNGRRRGTGARRRRRRSSAEEEGGRAASKLPSGRRVTLMQVRLALPVSAQPSQSRPTASYEADPENVHRVLLLYSGGLDTSVMLKWIQDSYEAEVVCLTVNLGQPGEDYEVIEDKALMLGAVECHVVDAREQFAAEFLAPAIRANAVYGNGYPLFTALGRPLIAQLAVEYARKTNCDTIAHGCTGKGNDQVRIEATVATLAPELRTIAPVRSWEMGREEEIAYAREHGIPVKGGTEVAPYSIDDNLWGRSSEGRWIEDLDHAPDDDVFQLVTRPEEAPDEAQIVTVGFEAGLPVSLDGERLGLVDLLEKAAEIGCRHGVGIVDHIEDRIVGLKVRDIYEVPAAAIVLTAHEELERLVGTIHQNQFKPAMDQKWGYLVYAGLWWEPLRSDIDAYMDAVNAQVTRRDRPAPLQRQRPRRHPLFAQRRLRRRPGGLLGVGRAVLADRLAGLHRALVAAVADGPPDQARARGEGRGLMYETFGKLAVRFAYRYLRLRYKREIRIGIGVTAAVVAIAAFLASRNVREG